MKIPPLSAVVEQIENHAQEFLASVLTRMLSTDPQARSYAPGADDQTHISLAELLGALLDGTDAEGRVQESTLGTFRELSVDYRRFGATAGNILALGEAIRVELRELCADLPFETVLIAERAVSATALAMSEAIDAADAAGEAAAAPARVVEVERRSRRYSVVRLQAESETALPYRAGQYVPVTADYLGNTWRYLTPSIPANEWGQVEFHLRSDRDDIARLLAGARPGDRWLIGTGRGDFGRRAMDSDSDLLFISHGTGLAPLRALLFELMNTTHPPRLHFFVGAEYPGEHYELMGLWNLAATSPWLSVVPVSTHQGDAWWVQATEASKPPRGLHLHQYGSMAGVVTGFGSWADREVLIAGPDSWARNIRRALIRRGTPKEQIELLEM